MVARDVENFVIYHVGFMAVTYPNKWFFVGCDYYFLTRKKKVWNGQEYDDLNMAVTKTYQIWYPYAFEYF